MEYIITDNIVHFLIIALLGAMIFVSWLNSRFITSFKILYLLRWTRLILATLAGGEILLLFVDNAYPLALYSASLLIYLSIESIIYWAAISMTDWNEELSKKFETSNVSWSAQKRHIKLKDKITSQDFTKSGSFTFESSGETIHITTFDSSDKLTRLSVFFLPDGESTYVFSEAESITSNNIRISTKSHCIYSGFDKRKNVDVRLVTLVGNPLTILKIHNKRIKDRLAELTPMPSNILDDFNASASEEIEIAQKSGKLNPKSQWSTDGAFTDAGKYLFWKNVLLMKYLPMVMKN